MLRKPGGSAGAGRSLIRVLAGVFFIAVAGAVPAPVSSSTEVR